MHNAERISKVDHRTSPRAVPRARYTSVAVVLHWLIAVLMMGNVVLGMTAEQFPEGWIRPAIDTHKSVGITVLGLVLVRLLWRMGHPPPVFDEGMVRGERAAAKAVHGALYVLMLALPLSGWLHDSAWRDAAAHPMTLFGLVPWPRIGAVMSLPPEQKEAWHEALGQWHAWAGWVLDGLVLLHVAGALKHQWVDGKASLQRMGW